MTAGNVEGRAYEYAQIVNLLQMNVCQPLRWMRSLAQLLNEPLQAQQKKKQTLSLRYPQNLTDHDR